MKPLSGYPPNRFPILRRCKFKFNYVAAFHPDFSVWLLILYDEFACLDHLGRPLIPVNSRCALREPSGITTKTHGVVDVRMWACMTSSTSWSGRSSILCVSGSCNSRL